MTVPKEGAWLELEIDSVSNSWVFLEYHYYLTTNIKQPKNASLPGKKIKQNFNVIETPNNFDDLSIL